MAEQCTVDGGSKTLPIFETLFTFRYAQSHILREVCNLCLV